MSYLRAIIAALAAAVLAAGLLVASVVPAGAKQNSLKSGAVAKKAQKVGSCRSLAPRKRAALRSALKPRKLTNKRCQRYSTIMKRAKRPTKPRPKAPTQPQPTPTNPSGTVFGLSANGEPALRSAEESLGLTAGVVGVFADFRQDFPTAEAESAADRGAALLISWEPWNWDVKSQDQPDYSLRRIIDGSHDAYIASFARQAEQHGRPVFVRFAAEMNGDWHTWSTGYNGNQPGEYAAAYRRVVDVARSAGATNIKWMFNPIVSYEGSTPLVELYPGHEYVDWVALDGYNWGSLKWGWQSFTDIFTLGLAELGQVASEKPLAIAEVGCTPGPDKAAWVTDTMTKASQHGVRMFVWFEHNKETDWRLSADPATATAARQAVADLGWTTGGDYHAVRQRLGL